MKRMFFYLSILACLIILTSCKSVGGGAVYNTSAVFGGYAFIDYDVGQTNVGYIFGNAETGVSNTLNITQLGKLLFSINDAIYIFPQLGPEITFNESESFLNNVLFRAGLGIDIPLNNKLFLRGEGLYGINVGRLLFNNDEGHPNNLSIRLAFGYQINDRKTLQEDIAEELRAREMAMSSVIHDFYMPDFDQNYFDQNSFMLVRWTQNVYANNILRGTIISKIDGEAASKYFYSRPTDYLEYEVGIRAEWYSFPPGLHAIELNYRDEQGNNREIIEITAAGTVILYFEPGKAYQLLATPVGDKIQIRLVETLNLKGIRE
ncbi:MAG: porin family protein [Treponema sp.]|nr:porin family protein [Treponema sp.]